jgi:predicted ATPase
MLAEAYGKVGQTEDGLAAVAEALDWAQKTGGRYYEAELYRLKGTLTLQSQASLRQGNRVDIAHHAISTAEAGTVGGAHPTEEDEAEACFLKAIAVARQQQAKSLELRAVMSLSRLWQQQGKKAEARQLLADIHGWFTEGFDTKDLQEARALLEELAR